MTAYILSFSDDLGDYLIILLFLALMELVVRLFLLDSKLVRNGSSIICFLILFEISAQSAS